MGSKNRVYKHKETNIPGLLVDAEDEWILKTSYYKVNHKGYVCTMRYKGYGKPTFFQLHREVLKPPPGAIIDHINGNKLDNRKCNLRIVSQAVNMQNVHRKPRTASGVRGVVWHKVTQKWQARFMAFGKMIHVGMFSTVEEAAKAIHEARLTHAPGYVPKGEAA